LIFTDFATLYDAGRAGEDLRFFFNLPWERDLDLWERFLSRDLERSLALCFDLDLCLDFFSSSLAWFFVSSTCSSVINEASVSKKLNNNNTKIKANNLFLNSWPLDVVNIPMLQLKYTIYTLNAESEHQMNIKPDLPFLNIHNPFTNERVSVYWDKQI